MCFYVEKPVILTAKKDIKCYKSLYFTSKGKYISEFQRFTYKDGFHYYNKDFEKDINKNFHPLSKGDRLRYEGIHSFTTRSMVVSNGNIKLLERGDYVSIECYIPKGAKYLRNKEDKEYISSDLVVVGLLKK